MEAERKRRTHGTLLRTRVRQSGFPGRALAAAGVSGHERVIRLVAALVGFGALLWVALMRDWQAVDLAWAVWLSGIAMTAYGAFLLPWVDGLPALLEEDRGYPLLQAKHVLDTAVGGLVGAAFLGGPVAAALFWPLALPLNKLLPLLPPAPAGSLGLEMAVALLVEASMQCWPAALVCCAVQTPSVVRVMARKGSAGNKMMVFLACEALTAGGVVVIAFAVATLGGVLGASGEGVVDVVLIGLLLFPWAVLWGGSDERGAAAGASGL